ncbi:hypothetical protein [Selenomonas flueggei]|nr:hypothetical protein [Selenomonas flueggei]
MKRTKRECLMQRLPAPADILALIPTQEDTAQTAVICARENSLMLCASPEHVLACLAEREDKALSLIRRNAARLMARRRNIILPILHGCVLTPVKMYNARRGGIGYINTAYAALVLRRRGTGSDIALQNGDIIHSLWAFGTLERHMREGRALHFKLLNDVRRQLRFAEDLA